ncbi:MAG: hypothetical protein ACYC6L_10590, partial [Anaerolineae bacterium]
MPCRGADTAAPKAGAADSAFVNFWSLDGGVEALYLFHLKEKEMHCHGDGAAAPEYRKAQPPSGW